MSSRGSYYYEDEDDLDIRVTRQHSRSPAPRVYHEPHYRHTRPPYYETHSSGGYVHSDGYLIPAVGAGLHRSRSQGHRPPPPAVVQPQQQPVVINNRIYNERDDDDDYHHLQLAPVHSHGHGRSRSRSHSRSSFASPRDSQTDWELEKARKELAAYKLEKERKEEEKRIEKELELKRLKKEKEAAEEEELLKEERKKAIEKYKIEEAEKQAKAKKEKDEREKEYKQRLEEDLRKSGLGERQISVVLSKDKEKQLDPNRPTYTRMSRRHLSIETLNKYRIDYEFDQDPDYVLIKRWVPEFEQDFLWSHTREIRERRSYHLSIEGKKKKHDDVEFEFVRKTKKHERKPSPSPLLTFLAGGKR